MITIKVTGNGTKQEILDALLEACDEITSKSVTELAEGKQFDIADNEGKRVVLEVQTESFFAMQHSKQD